MSDLAAHTEAIRASGTTTPVRTVAEACDRIDALTGVPRRPTHVRVFLAGLGIPMAARPGHPGPPKKTSRTTSGNGRFSSTPN